MATFRLVAPRHLAPGVVELSGGAQLVVPPDGVVEIADRGVVRGADLDELVDHPSIHPPDAVVNHGHLRELLALGFTHQPESGTRPAAGRYDGEQFFDAAIGRPLWWFRGCWRGADGDAV